MVRGLIGVVAALGAGGGCLGDFGVDEVSWTCADDRPCGAGARCVQGLCVLDGPQGDGLDADADADAAVAPDADAAVTPEVDTATGLVCEAPSVASEAGGSARFTLGARAEDGRPTLTVTFAGLTTTVPLPPGVEVIEGQPGPLLECCEDPCCPPRE